MLLNSKLIIPVVIGAVVVLMAIGGGYFYWQSQKPNTPNPQVAQNDRQLIAEVGKMIDLPSETPTIATVTDTEKLKDQPFFQKAKNGDKVLIYANAKKAYLYSPSLKKILDVAPLNIGSPSASLGAGPSAQTAIPSPSPAPKVTPKP